MYKVTNIVLHPGWHLPSVHRSQGTWITQQRAAGGVTWLDPLQFEQADFLPTVLTVVAADPVLLAQVQ